MSKTVAERMRISYHRKKRGTLPVGGGIEVSLSAVAMFESLNLLPSDFATMPRDEKKAAARDAVTRFINDTAPKLLAARES